MESMESKTKTKSRCTRLYIMREDPYRIQSDFSN